jgi:hypothetical protein
VLVSRIDRLLARTDPFDLSQAVERHVRSLSGERIRTLLRTAGPRLGAYYRDEFARLTGSDDFDTALSPQRSDAVLQNAFVKFLKSNLRAIPIFGSTFGLAVLDYTPLDRAVAIGEERRNPPLGRAAALGGAALALVLAGAAGEHLVTGARAASQSPQPVVIIPPVSVATPGTTRLRAGTAAPQSRVIARADTSPSPSPATDPPQPTAEAAPPAVQAASPVVRTAEATPVPARSVEPPSGKGAIVVTEPPATPSPEPSDIDVSDMPEAYSDATPLPQETTLPAQVPVHGIHVPTPKPSPKKRSWIHRALSHLNPFKPYNP